MQTINSTGMRVAAFLISLNRRNLLLDGSGASINAKSYNISVLGPSLTVFKPSQALYFKCYSSFESDVEDSRPFKKQHKNPKILVLNVNGKETTMYLEEAEKFARHNNLSLVEMEKKKNERPKYKFLKVSELFQDKNKDTTTKKKKFIVKDVITEHDFQTKISSMLKYVEKGQTVVCVIDAVDPRGRLDEKLSIINKSKLKDYIVQNVKSSKKLTLYFEKKISQTDKSKEDQVSEADKSS